MYFFIPLRVCGFFFTLLHEKFSISLSFSNSLIPFYFISHFFLSSYPSHTQFFRPFSPSYDVDVVHVCAEFSTHIHRMCLLLLVLDVKEWARVSSFLYVITLLGITIKRGGVWHENSQASSTLIRDSFNV